MKYKKSIIIIMLAIFLFAIAAASASDVNETAIASEDTGIELSTDSVVTDDLKTSPEDTPLTQLGNEGIISEPDNGNFQALQDKIINANPGETITLENNYTQEDNFINEDGENSGIVISKSLTIDGQGHTIDAQQKSRIFHVKATNVIIKNINFVNGNGGNGGAINVDLGKKCNITNCNFTNNSANAAGAIFFHSEATVTNCSFIGNKAKYSGGAVYFLNTGNVANCNFVNNSATEYGGGAIYFNREGTVENCNFTDNKVTGDESCGGAVCFYKNSEGNVTNCSFTNNSATKNGGAIYFDEGSNGRTINCNFTNNSASNNGGAVCFYKDSEGNVTNCSFTNNSATRNGGAIYMNLGSIENCNFTDNTATRNGGAVYLSYNCEVINCNFTNNKATRGGAIDMGSSTVTNCNFTNNKATGDHGRGGAIYMSSGSVENCNFTNNTASEDGGAVYFYGNGDVTNCNFTNNTATYYGGAVYFYGNGDVTNCNFTNNSASLDGGAIDFEGTGTVTNCNFTNNKATGDYSYGGAIYFNREGTVKNCNFTDNKASGEGGAIYFYSSGNVTNCNFTNNSASNHGGAVYFSKSGRIINSNFTDNKANEGGAVFFCSSGNVTNCNFAGNNANYSGGAIYFAENSDGSVINCNFTANQASVDGGAVYFWDDGTVTNCNFTNNNAEDNGGAIWMSSGSVTNCNFTNNQATGSNSRGGAIYMYSGSVENCNFTNNTASRDGGAIRISSGSVENCNFTANQASVDGGAVYFWVDGTVTNCNFTNNNAEDYGGAVYFDEEGTVTNCNFTGNNATTGSAIYFWSTSATKTVSNSCFLNNRANAETLEVTKNDNNITITFTGNDNLLNAIYSRNDAEVTFSNVTYWSANGIAKTGSSAIKPSRSNKEAGQNITVSILVNDKIVLSEVYLTNENGTIVLDIKAGDNYFIGVRHDTDSYYTEKVNTTSNNTKFHVNVTSQTTNNKTVNITAKSNIPDEVIKGKLLFIVPNTNPINATYAGNGTWWALYTFDGAGDYNVNASYIGLDNVTINNATIAIRYDASVDVNNKTLDLLIGDTFAIIATTTPEGLNVSYIPDDSGVYSVDEYGKVTALRDGEGSILIKVKGNAGFAENSTIVNVTVSKIPTEISVLNDTLNLAVGDEIAAGTTLKPGDAGNLTYISDEGSVAKVKDGKIMAVGNGTAVITVSFGGSESYAAAENKTISVTVSCIPTHITVENVTSHPGDDVNITVKVAADDGIPFNGNINFTLPDSNAVPVKIVNGTGVVSWTVPENYEGKYPTKAIFDGNMRYLSSGAEGSIAVSKYGSKVTISPIANVDYGNNVTIKYNIENRTTVNVTIDGVADDRIIIRDDSITVIVPDAGNYSITIINRQNNLYESSNDTGSFAVSKVKSGLDVNGTSVYFGEDAVLNYTLTDAENINVSITDWSGKTLTEGVDYNITITGAQIIIGFFDDGAYTVSVTTVVDSNHIPASENVTVSINPISDLEVILAPMNQTVNYGDVINWTAKIVNNGPSYALKSYFDVYASEGLVFTNPSVHAYLNHYRVNVPFQLAPGSYFTILIDAMVNASNTDLTLNVSVGDEYCPDPNPANNNASATVKVEYANASINISVESEITAGDDLTVNVELPDDAFGNVTVSVGEKNYTQEVNEGKATITVPGMGAGENTIAVSYSGDKKYAPIENTVNVTVKKATAKLTAKAKTFKDTDKTKKYTVTLKDSNGKPIVDATVTLKVNGKTYSAKTNSKGQATFKLTKLTKTGTYTAVIRYAGDKNHTGVSVKAKITVKSTWKTIAKGSNYHSMVKKIQIALKSKGYYITYNGHQLMVDGIFDIYTENAVKQFQRANGLKVTGKVNLATAKKLGIVK